MIRQARTVDLKAIALIHMRCFPESYISQLSRNKWFYSNLLECFYKEFLNANPELFVVAEDINNVVIGFCMGYYMDNDNHINHFIKNNRFKIALKTIFLLFTGNKYVWSKLLTRIIHKPCLSDWIITNYKYEYIDNSYRGDLLSICLLPDYRGSEYAHKMIELFLKNMKNSGRKLCLLSVKQKNFRAIRFYERNGFELYRTRGTEGLTFMKLL